MLVSSSICLLAVAGFATAAQDPSAPGDFSNEGNFGAPFPETVYPGYESENPVVVAGSKAYQVSPPKYPSPWGEGLGDWAAAYEKAREFVGQLTLLEKVNLTTGTGAQLDRCVYQTGSVPRLGFRALCLQDSPAGVRSTDLVSVFPAGVNVAATWDRGLAYARGQAMGEEHHGKGSDMQLGPVAGPLGRVPEGGRNWEGFSPDPILTGQLFGETTKGIQSAGVMVSLKHYIGNEQEHFRRVGEYRQFGFNISHTLSSNIDDETIHELYLWPFADAIRSGATGVMCSYTEINGTEGCQNSYTLNYLLKGELGFQGPVVADWMAPHTGVLSALSGMDVLMPGDSYNINDGGSFFGANLTVAILNGTLPAWRLDDMVTRMMAAFYYVHPNDTHREEISFSSWTDETYDNLHFNVGQGYQEVNSHVDVRADHANVIREIGAKSIVLLKNVDNVLPLTGKEKLTAVFGEDAGPNLEGLNSCTDRACDQGTLAIGWGSGSVDYPYLITPNEAIQAKVVAEGGSYDSSLKNDVDLVGSIARRANVSIVFANANAGEGYQRIENVLGDRNNLTFFRGGDELVDAVATNCSNTILVVHAVGPVLLEKYKNHENITAIVWAGLPGQESGNSLVDVLYGKVNPGAKLPFTIGKDRKDYGTDVLYTPDDLERPQTNYKEGVYIDYRAFDKHNTTPTYEFGFGLSYTTFSYRDLRITKLDAPVYTPFEGYTSAAPSYGNFSKDPADYVFPANFSRVPLYHYPWINSTDLKESSGDAHYGSNDFVPEGAHDASRQPIPKAGGAPGGNPRLYDALYRVEATIKNTGSVDGDEIPQLYINRGGPYDPVRELRGFDRLHIKAGGSATFCVDLTRKDLAWWNTVEQDWEVRNSTKTVWVGGSSRSLPLKGVLA